MQIKTPMMKVRATIKDKFLLFTKADPIYSPMGIRERSTPRLNRVMLRIKIKELNKKRNILWKGMGVTVKLRKRTIITIGNTEKNDSLNLANNNFFNSPSASPFSLL